MRTLTILANAVPAPHDVCACDSIVWDRRSVPHGQRSIPRHLEEYVYEIRAELVSWAYTTGRAIVGGRQVQEWLQCGDRLSMWWCSLLFEQHPKVMPDLWCALKLRALERMIEADDTAYAVICLRGGDARLARALQDFCTATGRIFLRERPIEKARQAAHTGLAGMYYRLPALCRAVVRFGAWLWKKRRLPQTQDPRPVGIFGTIATYFPNIDAQAAAQGRFYSRYWESLHDALAAAGARIHWLFMAFPSPQYTFGECLQLRDRFRAQCGGHDTYHYIEEFIGPAEVWRALRRYVRLLWASLRIESAVRPLCAFAGSRMNMWVYLGAYFADSFRGWRALERCLHREAMLCYADWAGPQRWTVFPMENCPWERMLTEAMHSAGAALSDGQGRVYAVQHSTVRPTDFRYFDDPRTFIDVDCNIFQPDTILANGQGALAEFARAHVPQARLGLAEALRYMYLAQSADAGSPPMTHPVRLLIVTSFFADECEAHIRTLCDWLRTEHGLDVVLKPHPYLDVAPIFARFAASDLMPPILTEAVGELLTPGTVVWASNSTTVALEAVVRGLPVLVQTPEDDVDLSPLQGTGAVRVSTAADVHSALNALNDPNSGAWQCSLAADYLALDPALPRLKAHLGL